MKAKKNNGKVYNPASKKEVSCPTWQFVSDPNEYHVLGDNSKPTNQITHEEN